MDRRLISEFFALLTALITSTVAAAADPPPNVVLIFCDDMGYADLGCNGAPVCLTPRLDRMASDGVRFTDFYVSSPICSASRAALLTGAYHERVGIRNALGPNDRKGLAHSETTLAELLKARGYATGMAGKWHLGSRPSQLPIHHGFDEYLGLPYSSDMWPYHPEAPKMYGPLPLIEGDHKAKSALTPDDMPSLTSAFTDRAVAFIKRNHDRPFFFYLAPTLPHVPLFVSAAYKDKTGRGLYADVIAEIDASVGRILDTLKEQGLDEKTLVIFTSDNGPWLSYGDHSGLATPLREGKGTTFEGGVREPFVARWPGQIPAGTVRHEPAVTIDILPTIAALTGSPLPPLPIDGVNITPLLRSEPGATAPHAAIFFYYEDGQLQAMRSGRWKLLFPHKSKTMLGQTPGHGGKPGKYKPMPVGLSLYDLDADIGETHNLAADHPDVIQDLQRQADAIRTQFGDSLTRTPSTVVRPAGIATD